VSCTPVQTAKGVYNDKVRAASLEPLIFVRSSTSGGEFSQDVCVDALKETAIILPIPKMVHLSTFIFGFSTTPYHTV
jgi:hypothetical protein